MLTDRFFNGDSTNDINFGRNPDGDILRNFLGGDFKGITQKIDEGYFDSLGVTAIWFTPPVEQIHGSVDEGYGKTYGYHGYWTKDWTALDPNYGTVEELKEMVDAAHAHGIRVIWDAVLNHTGPVTDIDVKWPDEWVRTRPTCTYEDRESTVTCTLVENLPDIKTESEEEVELPAFLAKKWNEEGRYEQEMEELDQFFERTAYPRTPTYYIIKWLTDWITELGLDGYRVDTAKHTEAEIWAILKKEAIRAFEAWKVAHPDKVVDDSPFYMTGEVYGYSIKGGLDFDYGDEKENFFDDGFESLINFSFISDANESYQPFFQSYSTALSTPPLSSYSVVNYVSSHDDGNPFDALRERPFEAANRLLLSPGAAQIYYGDESARVLTVEGAKGDAHLRSFMNWDEIADNVSGNGYQVQEVLSHWRKLGQFRKYHPAIGAGQHELISESPFVFQRTYTSGTTEDKVVVSIVPAELIGTTSVEIPVGNAFTNGEVLRDAYTNQQITVNNGSVKLSQAGRLVLLESL